MLTYKGRSIHFMNSNLLPEPGKDNTSIAIICHRPTWATSQRPGYYNLAVGNFCNSKSLNERYSKDSAHLNNISDKNEYYCELTGLHAIANQGEVSNNKIIGLVHYRRRFAEPFQRPAYKLIDKITKKAGKALPRMQDRLSKMRDELCLKMEVQSKSIEKLFKSQSEQLVILPPKRSFKETVYEQYCICHPQEDIDKCRNALAAIYPAYVKSFDCIMNSKKMHCFNMIIAKQGTIKAYSDWLFSLLSRLEESLSLETLDRRDSTQRRAYGFLAERLLNVYMLYHQELMVKELPCIFLQSA